MEEERYPGERRGLTLFLGDLLPVVERALGADSLLAHCARRALRRGGLRDLRHARQIFNSLPRDTRSRLTKALVVTAGPAPARHELLEVYSCREPTPFVCFETQPEAVAARPASVTIRHELLDTGPVTVLVRPGTLPSAAARALREIAALIEDDRRLLSTRFWSGTVSDGSDQVELG
ncbi:MAG TPA: hypothetical protein PKA13_18525 [Geminicoccaceae bacterium]|nr:hypothetical protein [Geminicoccus sp.]HMU51778.1 hypothetical protein [Geminicoccaceae bacterium]